MPDGADDFSLECIDVAIDFGISGQYVTRFTDQAAVFRGYPAIVRTDNGPGIFMDWTQSHGVRHILIEPGRPMQNGYIESLNAKFRDDCLNEHWFETLVQARSPSLHGSRPSMRVSPHSSCRRISPL